MSRGIGMENPWVNNSASPRTALKVARVTIKAGILFVGGEITVQHTDGGADRQHGDDHHRPGQTVA